MAKIPKVIVLIETSRAYGRNLLNGIARYSFLNGPWLLYNEPARGDFHDKLKDWDADGIILQDAKENQKLLDLDLPTIVSIRVKEKFPDLPCIKGDSETIGQLAAEHLIDRGFNNFAYCGFNDMPWSLERGQSFHKRINQAGFATLFYEASFNFNWDKEQDSLISWLTSLPKPAGLMVCNDDRGQNIIQACKTAGIKIPEEIAIIGVNNDDMICNLSNPPLSSIALSTERAGYESAELLDSMMKNEDLKTKTIWVNPTHIVNRQSTNVLVMEDDIVKDAIHYIWAHFKEKIGVEEVVNISKISQRVLERRFNDLLGRSIKDEIRRVRCNYITQLLMETDMPITKITSKLDFTSVDHVARYFKREKGVSLLEFRKRFGRK